MILSSELRKKYIEFFKSKGHAHLPSASVVPENDPSSLFITAGMQPLIPFLMGEKHPAGNRIVDVQKCVRTGDIDEVGDFSHLTFFEMFGNWSLGDYFKKESLEWSFEFLTDQEKGLGLDPERIFVTVFRGEDDVPRDEVAIKTWQDIFENAGVSGGVAENGETKEGVRIVPLGKKDNFWIAGSTGPCGGDSEIFYDTRPELGLVTGDFEELSKNRLMEIWNNVFMEFEKKEDGSLEKLSQQNVDTGMGLERTIVALNGLNNVYETDLFQAILEKISEISGKEYTGDENDETTRPMRIIADHVRTATVIMSDEARIEPTNTDQGYVVRKLIRRAIRQGKMIGIENNFLTEIAEVVIVGLGEVYLELKLNRERVLKSLRIEENKFLNVLNKELPRCEKSFDLEMQKLKMKGLQAEEKKPGEKIKIKSTQEFTISGKLAFKLYSERGIPIEIQQDLAKQRGYVINEEEFDIEMKKHQDLSNTASAGKFKGGLGNHSEQAIKYHTATHLLLAALRNVLGEDVYQKGSNITDERMRFDFSYPEKMTDEQKTFVEDLVNDFIEQDLPIVCEEETPEEAKTRGAMGVFGDKYGEMVKVYSIGGVDNVISCEICGGPHVEKTGELGHFRIKKEESSSSGVRRIKAVLE
jgi:alanyl-tRNA synthetase